MEFPITMIEFMHQFADDDACRAYLKKMRWPDGFVCPRCQGTSASYLVTRRLHQCRTCRHQVSVTAGTIFHATQTSLQKWFLAIFFVSRHKQGISALQLQRDLGLGSYQTAWTMLHKLRSGLGRPHRAAAQRRCRGRRGLRGGISLWRETRARRSQQVDRRRDGRAA
jgi:hypothetical protein